MKLDSEENQGWFIKNKVIKKLERENTVTFNSIIRIILGLTLFGFIHSLTVLKTRIFDDKDAMLGFI